MSKLKCKNCGNNLNIDDARCPFCGSENKIAAKHREDMLKYSTDYGETKERVIKSSGNVNRKAIRITVIAVTIAAIAILTAVLINIDDIAYKHYHESVKGDLAEEQAAIDELIAKEDYISLNRLIQSKQLTGVRNWEEDQYDVLSLTEKYNQVFMAVMNSMCDDFVNIHRNAETIESEVINFEDTLYFSKNIPEKYKEYVEHMASDMRLMLKTYLNISEEKYNDIFLTADLSKENRVEMIEEVLNEIFKTR